MFTFVKKVNPKISFIQDKNRKNHTPNMFTFVKRVDTKKNSIFYSFIHYNNEILGFCRKHYGQELRLTKNIKIDDKFNIIEDNNETFCGEDPRCFIHNKKLYVTDNYLDKQKIYDYDNKTFINIKIHGKNSSFISHKNTLYYIHRMMPFALYKIYTECERSLKINVEQNENNFEYRGGTSGYRFKKEENKYYGFGHRTYNNNNILKHDVFLWIVDFTNENPSIIIKDLPKPPNSKNICDPTCVIEINGKLYMVTAESDSAWFCEQDYVTNVYQITDYDFIKMVL
jgi:hypothetical protein